MVPKESGFNLSETACGLCVRIVWRFICSPAMARDGEIISVRKLQVAILARSSREMSQTVRID